VNRALASLRAALGRLFFQRCIYLFFTLVALITVAPLIEPLSRASLLRNAIGVLLILAIVATVGRTIRSFLLALVLALPALLVRWGSADTVNSPLFRVSLYLDAALYAVAIAFLLQYVFDREVITGDRLWGAAATYLLIGVFWAIVYAIIDEASPGAFAMRGETTPLHLIDLFYFSFSTLTTTGFGDIVPVTRLGRTAATLEAVAGNLFQAILIARLVGIYRQPREDAGLRAQSYS
jgi:Ion channel